MSSTPSFDSRYPRMTIRLPQWLLSYLKSAAAADGTTAADLVRSAVIDHLSRCHAIGPTAAEQGDGPIPVVITRSA